MGCSCQNDSEAKFDGASAEYKRALWWVIGINAAMFFVEIFASFSATSQALQADALDFLGDSATYTLSLLVIGHSLKSRNNAALLKAASLLCMGLAVFGMTIYRLFILQTPEAVTMGSIGLLAFIANISSVLILLRFRDGDANVRSVWLCSRNDAIGNIAVMLAALGVWQSQTAWPDLIVAALMASLFIWSSIQILTQVLRSQRSESDT